MPHLPNTDWFTTYSVSVVLKTCALALIFKFGWLHLSTCRNQGLCLRAQALQFLSPEARSHLALPCGVLLQRHISAALAGGVEALSDSGRDRMFNGVSALFSQIYSVQAYVTSPVAAEEVVSH
jgi:hypothetical protein